MTGAIRSASVAMTPAVTAAYNCTQFLGAGIGTRLASILDASPASKGILFDKPHLRAELRPRSRSSVFCRNMNSNVCFTGSTSFRLKFLHCENDEKTFPADRCFCSHLEISFLPN